MPRFPFLFPSILQNKNFSYFLIFTALIHFSALFTMILTLMRHFVSIITHLLFLLFVSRRQLVQFTCSVMSDSLWPHESQHAKPPRPSPTPGVHRNSCPSSRWCHPTISSSVVPFSYCPQSLPASGSFPMSQLFSWGGQRIGVSALVSVLPMNTQDWSPLGRTGSISL